MITTDIRFNEKQDFETIKSVIEKEFTDIQTYKTINDLDYISFDHKGQNIFCSFMKHNRIYGNGNVLTECSSFSSDRPNGIKTEAFKIIAKYFDCRFWENDCVEEDYIDFKKTKKVTAQRLVYLITNETDRIVESAWYNFKEAKKECQKLEKLKPQKLFMVVELIVNGL